MDCEKVCAEMAKKLGVDHNRVREEMGKIQEFAKNHPNIEMGELDFIDFVNRTFAQNVLCD